jgi:hypothetical protein
VFIGLVLTSRYTLIYRNKKKIAAQAGQIETDHAHAFEDLTDMENPDFRYSI